MTSTPFFDKEAEKWSERYTHDTRFARRFDRITTLLSRYLPAHGFSALDAGCGSGVFSRWLADHGGNVTAIDPSREMIRRAAIESENRHILFVESDILTFSSSMKFDVVVALSVLEYVAEQKLALDRLAALSEALLVISVPNRKGLIRRVERLALRLRRSTRGALFSRRGEYLQHQRYQWESADLDAAMSARGLKKLDHCFVGTSVGLPKALLPFFERSWWAAMYCGVYRCSTPLERVDRA